MKDILKEWRTVLKEDEKVSGQTGVKFENVVVSLARGEGGGKFGSLKFKGSGMHKGKTFEELGIRCLQKMGLSPGDDPAAEKFSIGGIAGDPKTDIGIQGKRISVKLPGAIQLASGEARSSSMALELALEEYLQEDFEVEEEVRNSLEASVREFINELSETIGKYYLPVDPESEDYASMLRDKARQRLARKGVRLAPEMEEQHVEAFVEKTIKKVLSDKFSIRKAATTWQQFKKDILPSLKKRAGELSSSGDSRYYHIVVDEMLSGRRQFVDSPTAVAEYLLSPDSFLDITTLEKTAYLADSWKDYIKWDVRAKGRPHLSKAVTVRIGFQAEQYYRAIRDKVIDAVLEGASTTVKEQDSEEKELAADIVDEILPDLLDTLDVGINIDVELKTT